MQGQASGRQNGVAGGGDVGLRNRLVIVHVSQRFRPDELRFLWLGDRKNRKPRAIRFGFEPRDLRAGNPQA